jgi:hypothetical protein
MKILPHKSLASMVLFMACVLAFADSTKGWQEVKNSLPGETDLGGGLVAKAGPITVWAQQGAKGVVQQIASFTLAKDWVSTNGIGAYAGSLFCVYPNGAIRSLVLGSDWNDTAGRFVLPAGETISFHDTGAFSSFKTKRDLQLAPDQPIIKAKTPIFFSPEGRYQKSLTLAADFAIPGTPWKAESGSSLTYHDTGTIQNFILALPGYSFPDGMKIPPHTKVWLSYDGKKISSCQIEGTWKSKAGVVISGEIGFSVLGMVTSGTLVLDFACPDGPTFKAGNTVHLYKDGNIESGVLAADFNNYKTGERYSREFESGGAYDGEDIDLEDWF